MTTLNKADQIQVDRAIAACHAAPADAAPADAAVIIDKNGVPWPVEFTPRPGWPVRLPEGLTFATVIQMTPDRWILPEQGLT